MEPDTNPTQGLPPQPETPNTGSQPTPLPEQPSAPAPTPDNGEWPGAFGIFKRAAAATKVNLLTILTFDLIAILVGGLGRNNGLLKFIGILVGVWAQLALISLYLASSRNQEQSFADAARVGVQRYVDGFIASIVTAVLVGLSIIALIVPFFFVLPRLQFVMYYVVDKGMGPIDAIKASWADSKGYSLKVWGAIGVSILFGVLCVLLVGIYLLFMYQTVFALLYLHIVSKKPAEVSEPAAS